jgi:beta-lactamase regulating signal transducer with metallopeptidase domain
MHIMVYLPLVVPALAAGFARPLAERLPPTTATWLLTVSAVLLAAASSAMLGLLALAAALHVPALASLGRLSVAAAQRADPPALPLGVVAGILLVIAGAASARAAWRRIAALLGAHREVSGLEPAGQIVIVADDSPDAYAVPGWRGHVVVTSGMLEALTAAEHQVLLAHERAHASGRHYLFTAAARFAAAANPLLRPVSEAVGYSVERWADERAALAVGSRRLAARTIAKAALASATGPPSTRPAVLPGMAATWGTARPGLMPRRVGALLIPPPRRGLILVALTVALLLACGAAALDAAVDLHALIEIAQAAVISP